MASPSSSPLRRGHLTEETILQLTTGELDGSSALAAEAHLEQCGHCQREVERSHTFRRTMAKVFQDYSPEVSVLSPRAGLPVRPRWLSWVAAGVAASLVLWAALPRRLEAKEILDRALTHERRGTAAHRRVRIQAGPFSCTVGLEPAADRCANTHGSLLQSVPWDWNNPLSAAAFSRWRSSVANKRDRVRRTKDGIVLTTQSAEGPIREAELTLTPADYRATHAKLWPSSHTPIEILEERATGSGTENQVAVIPDGAPSPSDAGGSSGDSGGAPVQRAADTAEVNAWLALAQFHLLDGWKATVRRNGERVEILGAMDAATREEIAKAISVPRGAATSFAARPSGESFAPARESFSDSPPLGAIWIRQELPPGEDVTGYTNRVLSASQAVLGLTNSREWLVARHGALRGQDARRLEALARRQRQEQLAATRRLVELLRPLLDSTAADMPLLSREQAYRLDAALIHVFASGPAVPQSLAGELAEIESVLPVRLRPL